MSNYWHEIHKQQQEINRRLDEIAHKRTQEILKERRPSYCMHTPPEVLHRLGQRHRESFPTDDMERLCQTMANVAKEDAKQKIDETTTRKQDFFKEYGIEETVMPGME